MRKIFAGSVCCCDGNIQETPGKSVMESERVGGFWKDGGKKGANFERGTLTRGNGVILTNYKANEMTEKKTGGGEKQRGTERDKICHIGSMRERRSKRECWM